MNTFSRFLLFCLLLGMLAGCVPGTPYIATPTQTAVANVSPTAGIATPTLQPTATASPTATATATEVPTATATATELPTATATATRLPTLTATPSATPSATATPLPTVTPLPAATATATASPTALPTATPTPTQSPAITPTPFPVPSNTPTATPSATPDMSGTPEVLYFRLQSEPVRPSQPVILEWAVRGVSEVTIVRVGGEWGDANEQWTLPASGTLQQTYPPEVGGWPIMYHLTSSEAPNLAAHFDFRLACEYDWVFDLPYPGGTCPVRGVVSRAAQQSFERGFMVWIADQNLILYSTYSGLEYGEVADTYVQGVDPINDPTIVPPAGLYQPEYGFGKVWRTTPGVRDLLGWATEWGSEYTVKRQSTPPHRYGWTEYISLRNGGLITINHPEPWWRIDYR